MGLKVDAPKELCEKPREAPTVYHCGSIQCLGGHHQLPGGTVVLLVEKDIVFANTSQKGYRDQM